jgi:Capsule assembly protein Wzi
MTYFPISGHGRITFPGALLCAVLLLVGCGDAWAVASNNVPLSSPVYQYLDVLTGLGLIKSEVKGIRPYSKAEVARLVAEAELNLKENDGDMSEFGEALIKRVREFMPREVKAREEPSEIPGFAYNFVSSANLRYVYLNGEPRSYDRVVHDPGHQSAFGFIGGDLRPDFSPYLHGSGSEGTPLMENSEGVVYRRGSNGYLNWTSEFYVSDKLSLLFEPDLVASPGSTTINLQKGYFKLGGGGVELEVGRDANWFGPGYRGALTLTNNARNFDQIKLSSPEPLDVAWVKRYLGLFKYSLIFSRFNQTTFTGVNPPVTGSSTTVTRQPYFIGVKLALKPASWWEIGINFVRQHGGPGFSGGTSVSDYIFGGGSSNKSNTIAGVDLRFRIPWLRNTELYAEYAGEDAASFWPFVESYIAGIYIPCLSVSGRDNLRLEYYFGHQDLYTDYKFPTGYTYYGMTPGHSQGGGTQDLLVRYSHWFTPRNNVALEYIYTDRGRQGRMDGQVVEIINAMRGSWTLPFYREIDAILGYGRENIRNQNLVSGVKRTNQVATVTMSYKY